MKEDKDGKEIKDLEEKIEINENKGLDKNNEKNQKEKYDFKFEKEQLNNLGEKIDEAYEEHLNIINKPHNREENINNSNDINNLIDLNDISKKRKISIISNILIYNYEKNNKISSLISTKLNNEILLALEDLLSLINLIYFKKKNLSDNEEANNLIKQAFDLLIKFTICPYNHKIIMEKGLLSFLEKLNKNEDYQIYIIALGVLKNCTYDKNAIQFLILSKYYDIFLDEILEFYDNIKIINDNDEKKLCFNYCNIILNNILKDIEGFDSFNNKKGFENILKIANSCEKIDIKKNIIII